MVFAGGGAAPPPPTGTTLIERVLGTGAVPFIHPSYTTRAGFEAFHKPVPTVPVTWDLLPFALDIRAQAASLFPDVGAVSPIPPGASVTTINAALSGQDVVHFTAGAVYTVNNPVICPRDGAQIYGHGATLKTPDGVNITWDGVFQITGDNVRVRDLIVDMNANNSELGGADYSTPGIAGGTKWHANPIGPLTTQRGVRLIGTRNFLENCTVRNSPGGESPLGSNANRAAYVMQGRYNTLYLCKIVNGGMNGFANYGPDSTFIDCDAQQVWRREFLDDGQGTLQTEDLALVIGLTSYCSIGSSSGVDTPKKEVRLIDVTYNSRRPGYVIIGAGGYQIVDRLVNQTDATWKDGVSKFFIVQGDKRRCRHNVHTSVQGQEPQMVAPTDFNSDHPHFPTWSIYLDCETDAGYHDQGAFREEGEILRIQGGKIGVNSYKDLSLNNALAKLGCLRAELIDVAVAQQITNLFSIQSGYTVATYESGVTRFDWLL